MEHLTQLTPSIKNNLATTVLWAKYAAIVSLVNLGLGFLQLIVGAIKGNSSVFGAIFSFLISGAITLVMSINLLNFSKYAKMGVDHADSTKLYQALYHLKVYFTVMGVLFLIAIGLLVLVFIIALIVGIIAAATN